MPLDGAFLYNLRREIDSLASETRVDKVSQPSRDEIILSLHKKGFSGKILFTLSDPRFHFTQQSYENPAQPPMFCMLMRKYFVGAKYAGSHQDGLERVVRFDFDTYNELGDSITVSIVAEIMGRGSNLILLEGNRIIDALRRTSVETGKRMILPGAEYEPPESQNKVNPLESDSAALASAIRHSEGKVSDRILGLIDGVSPLIAREIAFRAAESADADTLDDTAYMRLRGALDLVKSAVSNGKPTLIYRKGGTPYDYSYMDIAQYGGLAECRVADSFSGLLDGFYGDRRREEDMRRRTHDLMKLLTNSVERISRKINKQRAELKACADKERLRICGELIKANIAQIERGAAFCEVMNYYDPEYKPMRIKLDEKLSAAQNAQKYFKEYKKAHTAEEKLTALISDGEQEIAYLESVFDALTRAECESDIADIRSELADGGYIRRPPQQKNKQKSHSLPPHHYISSDGYDIYVGRNNVQNDRLTLKTAARSDIWLHTKGIHGAHVIIDARGGEVPESTVLEAARIAAYHSKGRQSSSVPVDYVRASAVKKPNGARPGMVIYDGYKTVYVTADEKEVKSHIAQ